MQPAHGCMRSTALLPAPWLPILCLEAAGQSLPRERENTMTYLNTTHAPVATGLSGIFATLRQSITDRVRKSRAYHRTRSELDAMSDRDLADIGIARFMIDDVAAEAAARA